MRFRLIRRRELFRGKFGELCSENVDPCCRKRQFVFKKHDPRVVRKSWVRVHYVRADLLVVFARPRFVTSFLFQETDPFWARGSDRA